jgi:RNA polymerase sigma-70 factor (ECF subfamily)
MTVGTNTTGTDSDPLTAALADPAVAGRLIAAAKAFLGRRAASLTATQRAADAEELVAEARQRAWARRDRFDPSQDVVAWLVAFVSNVAREYVRRRSRDAAPTGCGPPGEPPRLENLAVDLARAVPDQVADRQFRADVDARLSQPERDLLRMKYDEDLTFAEIGERLEMTECAVRVWHHRVVGRLRQEYRESREVRS